MRSFLLGKKTEVQSWTNPYITDGLVAMWDGEWNAGGGVHDENATVWKDLGQNGLDLIIRNGDDFLDWGENSFNWGTEKFGWISDENKTEPIMSRVLSNDALTIEIVAEPLSNNTSLTGYLCRYGTNFGVSCTRGDDSERQGVAFSVNGNITLGITYGSWGNKAYRAGTASDGTGRFYFKNSNKIASDSRNQYTTFNVPQGSYARFCIGVRDDNENDSPVKNLRLYSVRWYSRKLTEDELTSNYAIDARRFGL